MVRPGTIPGEEEPANNAEFGWLLSSRIRKGDVVRFSELKHLVPVPDSVSAAIEKAMSFKPDDRYATVGAFVQAMESGVDEPGIPVPLDSPTEAALQKWTEGKSTVVLLGSSEEAKAEGEEPILLIPTAPNTQTQEVRQSQGRRNTQPVSLPRCWRN